MSTLEFVLIGLAYLLGSISFAVLISRLYGLPDPRSFGSKNPGATNMLRGGNKVAALWTLLGDVLKGVVALVIARVYLGEAAGPVFLSLVALAAFLGHVFPIFFGFQGGKGVATAAGLLLVLTPPVGLLCVGTWLLVFGVTRVSSMSALFAMGVGPIGAWFWYGASAQFAAVSVMALVLLIRHASNIGKLLSGEEKPFRPRPSEKG